jgi:hypothetical protein
MKTEEEISELKSQWYRDPIWDIENTEGFEEHKSELLSFRRQCELGWEKAAKYRRERSTKYQLDLAINAVNDADNLDQIMYSNMNYLGAIAHSLLALVAELKRMNDIAEGE